jgi:hypothetical protein
MRKTVQFVINVTVEADSDDTISEGLHDMDIQFISQTQGFRVLSDELIDVQTAYSDSELAHIC